MSVCDRAEGPPAGMSLPTPQSPTPWRPRLSLAAQPTSRQKKMKRLLLSLLAAAWAVCLVGPTYGEEEPFPLRAKWPKLLPVITEELSEAQLGQFPIYLRTAVIPKRDILMTDNVWRQVIWHQCYLKKHGCKDYYFLRGGLKQWREDGLDSKGRKPGRAFGDLPTS